MRLLLVGNYGVGNLGDELLKEYFLEAFPDVEWTMVSAAPLAGEVPRLPLGIRSLLTTPWRRTLRALQLSDGLVFGGGSLFTDTESVFACVLWWWHALWARALGKHVYLAFQGIGPFRTRVGEWCARWVVTRAAFVSVRDTLSAQRVENWRLNKKVVHSFDPVFTMLSGDFPRDRAQKVFIIIPRRNSREDLLRRAQEIRGDTAVDGVTILSFQWSDRSERSACERIAAALGANVRSVATLRELREALSSATFVLSERYHGALAALAMGIPFEGIPQRDGDKLRALVLLPSEEAVRLVQHGEHMLAEVLQRLVPHREVH